jgi:hypothetical protein
MTETGDDANSEGEMGDMLDPSMMESGGQGQVGKPKPRLPMILKYFRHFSPNIELKYWFKFYTLVVP